MHATPGGIPKGEATGFACALTDAATNNEDTAKNAIGNPLRIILSYSIITLSITSRDAGCDSAIHKFLLDRLIEVHDSVMMNI